jgi:hypothetical protein
MTIPEILIWEATNALLLIPARLLRWWCLFGGYEGGLSSPNGIGFFYSAKDGKGFSRFTSG